MTIGCDTSFLLRILTNHPVTLASKAIEYAYRSIRNGDSIEVSDIVLSEAYYALQASYGVSKTDALTLLAKISSVGGFCVTSHAKEVLSTPNLANSNPGFVDRLIHGEYFASGKKTVACEKSFKKLPQTDVVR
jgi:predicted nucleic-acid-binding protein